MSSFRATVGLPTVLVSLSTAQFPSVERCKMRGWFVVMVLIAMLIFQGTAQLTFRPDFHLNQYQANEGASVVIRLSARVLTTLPFNGSIEVDITAEDLPRKNAEFDVEVNFKECSYTVTEGEGQVSVSLRIDGRFFVPVWAIVEISDGTATDPEDHSSAGRYNVTFRQTVFSDREDPADTALSSPILINITNDDTFEGVEYFQAHIIETSDEVRVRIGQDTVNITITDSSCSPWLNGSCSTLPCGGVGVRTDVRLCTSPTPSDGRVHCRGAQWRNTTCFTCPCGGSWSTWVEGTCSKTCGLGTRLDQRRCTTPDHKECCPGCGLRQSNCSVAECPVHGGWSSWLEVTSCSVSCGGGTKFLVRECNEPVPAHGGNDCDGLPFKVENCNDCPCDAGWSSWVPGACDAPCGQNGTAIATRKCSGPSECCSGEGKRTEVCTSPPCQGR